ncbi:methyltransferase [Coniochaeta ligniaria NRRL 30616]|uniref:Methyltransferase n=1 Tax=Coniochaeta ligniaria NRRL 30616 TaxID=1408157 RepID=A0A1J7I636_9PEZI|nr:methyltransferase [Coniochaeta ligniaria NRRL 30616]
MTVTDTAPGAAVYSPFFLRWVYDAWVLNISNSYAWCCSAAKQRAFYSRNLASARGKDPFRLCDIGVATGYYLEHAPIPEGSEVTVVDLNTNSLDAASERLLAAHPGVTANKVHGDFLEPDAKSELAITQARLGGDKFDAISCMFLLHCVPGPPARKAQGLQRLAPLLKDDGVLFGTTILGKGVQHNFFGNFLMTAYNKAGSFQNWDDDAESIVQPLRESFADVKFEVVGTVLLFEARKPKTR